MRAKASQGVRGMNERPVDHDEGPAEPNGECK
jgi:hypothetical protein